MMKNEDDIDGLDLRRHEESILKNDGKWEKRRKKRQINRK